MVIWLCRIGSAWLSQSFNQIEKLFTKQLSRMGHQLTKVNYNNGSAIKNRSSIVCFLSMTSVMKSSNRVLAETAHWSRITYFLK